MPQQERKSNLRVTYDQASQYFKMPDFDTYSKAMTTVENRKGLYDQLSQHYKMPEYGVFEKTLSSEINPVSAIDPVPETIDFNTRALEFLGFSGIAENRRIAEAAVKQQTGESVTDVSSEFKNSPFAQHVPAPNGAADFIKQFGKAALGDPIAQASVRNFVNTPLVKPSESLPKNMSEDEIEAEFAMTPLAALPTSAKKGMYGFFRGAVEVAEGLTTPANLTLLIGLARAPQGIARAFSALFGVEMAKAVPEQVTQFKEAMENGNVEDAGQALAHIIGTGTFTTLAAKHALGVGKVSDPGLKKLADDIQANPESVKLLPEPSFIPAGGRVAGNTPIVPEPQLALPAPAPRTRAKGNKTLADLIDESVSPNKPKVLPAAERKQLGSPTFIPVTGKVRVEAKPKTKVGNEGIDVPIEGSRGVDISLKDAIYEKYQGDIEAFERDFKALPRAKQNQLYDELFIKERSLSEAKESVLPKEPIVEGTTRQPQTPPKGSGSENIFDGTPGVRGVSAAEAAAKAKPKNEFSSRNPLPPPPVMQARIKEEVFSGTSGTQSSAREALKSEYNKSRESEDIKRLKEEGNRSNVTDPITARDIKHKLVQDGKDLGNLTRDDIVQARQSILESRQREVGPDKPRDVPPETSRAETKEDVKAALNETDGYISRLKSDANSWGQRLADWFDVEAPFRRSGAPQTGIKVKGYYGQRELREEIAIKTAKGIAKDLRHDPDLLSKVVIYAENPRLFNQAPPEVQRLLAKPIRDLLKYFSDARELYSSRGVDVDFKHRIRNDIEASIRAAKKENKPTDGLESALKDLDNFEFVHIPTALWFERAAIEGNNNIGRILKVMAEKKRNTFRIQDLIDAGLIELKDVNAVDVIMNYGRRLGKDIGLLDIVNAAKSEGLASKEFKNGFVKPPRNSVAFRDTWVHPTLNDWLISMGSLREGMNVFEKVVSGVKMGQFYNPLFLPMYDVVQATMLGSANLLHPIKSVKGLYQGMRDVFTQSERYVEALDNGLASTPFNNPFKSYMDHAKSIKSGEVGEAAFLIKSILKGNPFPSLRAFYDASFNLAWQLDRGIRMASYNYLIEKGLSPQQAAQIAARFHGDYASVPATTRRAGNNIFFTPTFKIAMTKLYSDMMKGSWESTKAAVKKDGSLDPKHPAYARGIVGMGGVLIATDLVMLSLGFERDTFGVRYVKTVDTEEGPKELVVTLSNPANMPIKYADRIARSFRGDQLQSWKELAKNLEYEITPLYRITKQLIENKDPDGNIIYNEFGTKPIHSLERAAQMTRYLFENSFAVVGDSQEALFTDPNKQTAQEKLADEIGKTKALIMYPFVFTYLRDPEELQIKTRLDKVQSRFQQLLKEEQLEADDENVERFLKTLDVILEDIDELKDKKASQKN